VLTVSFQTASTAIQVDQRVVTSAAQATFGIKNNRYVQTVMKIRTTQFALVVIDLDTVRNAILATGSV
jgi:hypothetical protein